LEAPRPAAFGEPRSTNGVDILAEFTPENLDGFLRCLPKSFYFDLEEALRAFGRGRPFNSEELDRAIPLEKTGLSKGPVRFVTPEDILLAKLHWFKSGGEVSELQWRDIEGVIRACAVTMDRGYLERSAAKLGVLDLLNKALGEA
jgi:hypothetical protein